jgi:hypothetical protein
MELCTLEYRPSKTDPLQDVSGRIIVCVYRSPDGMLAIEVERSWQAYVEPEDVSEVNELLADLSARSVVDPSGLWCQLIQINWGLIVTGTVRRISVGCVPQNEELSPEKAVSPPSKTSR